MTPTEDEETKADSAMQGRSLLESPEFNAIRANSAHLSTAISCIIDRAPQSVPTGPHLRPVLA